MKVQEDWKIIPKDAFDITNNLVYMADVAGEIYYAIGGNDIYLKKSQKLNNKKKSGYRTCKISGKQFYSHRLVAAAFYPGGIDQRDNMGRKYTVDHIDGCKHNNHKDNLQWVSQLKNNRRYEVSKKKG